MRLDEAIWAVRAKRDLKRDEIAVVIGELMDGGVPDDQIGQFLLAMREKGETADELAGATEAMLARATEFPRSASWGTLVDTCGTGGDGKGTLNISTLAALVVAAVGLRVAKHGNRASSSRAGSADLLEALGITIDLAPADAARSLDAHNFAFLFAPRFHPATRNVAAARRALGVRTLFNLLGPLSSPARPEAQVVGVPESRWIDVMAQTLSKLGRARAWVVHGAGEMDELSPVGETEVASLEEGKVVRLVLRPSDFGLNPGRLEDLAGGDAATNAKLSLELLHGHKSAARTAVLMSAAAAIHVARGDGLVESCKLAASAIDDGRAARLVEALK